MSTKGNNPFDLNQGLEGVSGIDKNNGLLERSEAPLPPTGQPVHCDLGSVMVRPRGLEEMLMRTLAPKVNDKMSMAPSRYHNSLARAAANLMNRGVAMNAPEVIQTAHLIVEELELLRTMSRVRSRQGG